MPLDFSADEVFEMAEQIERNGAKFYRKAVEGASSAQSRELLLDLAQKEDKHLAVVVELRSRLGQNAAVPTVFDPYGEAPLYLRAMADTHVFVNTPGEDLLSGQETAEQVLNLALGFEKDTITFFLGMKEIVPERLGKPEIDRLIKEEMNHVVILKRALAELG